MAVENVIGLSTGFTDTPRSAACRVLLAISHVGRSPDDDACGDITVKQK